MELLAIKVCVIIGLLFTTFVAVCLPLVLLQGYLKKKSGHVHGALPSFSSRLRNFFAWYLPCFKCCHKTHRDQTHVEEESEEKDLKSSEDNENSKNKKFRIFLNLMNCFSGGVFLGTSFLALMPEVREIFDEVGITWPSFYNKVSRDAPRNSTLTPDIEEETLMPITEILVTFGLFLILCIEQVVHKILDMDSKEAAKETGDGDEALAADTAPRVVEFDPPYPTDDIAETEIMVNYHCDMVIEVSGSGNDLAHVTTIKAIDKQENHHEQHDDSFVRSVILVTSLSIHSLLEGLAIGLQTKATSALSLFFAVLFHKSLMSFSMGNNLVQSGQSRRNVLIAATLLAFMSPTGISIGIIMKETKSGTDIINGVLQGIATGTFLFITFFEVLSKEFGNHSDRISKTIAFMLGYVCILGVMFTQHGA